MDKKSVLGAFFALSLVSFGVISGDMKIVMEYPDNSLNSAQKKALVSAAERWDRMLIGADSVSSDYSVKISATGNYIDHVGGVLAEAGPNHVRTGTRMPVRGVMRFDQYDLQDMEKKGTLLNVVTHEMGHVLGLGTMWQPLVKEKRPGDP